MSDSLERWMLPGRKLSSVCEAEGSGHVRAHSGFFLYSPCELTTTT